MSEGDGVREGVGVVEDHAGEGVGREEGREVGRGVESGAAGGGVGCYVSGGGRGW